MIEYNTKRSKLLIREYGRNVQKMVEDTMKIEDREQRNAAARAIIRVMAQLNDPKEQPTVSVQEPMDYWHKLWDHLIIISDYKLDIDSPFPKPVPDTSEKKVVKPDYNKHRITLRTYGRNMQNVIKEVSSYPEKERERMAKVLANDLKLMYLSYNRNSVNDELIKRQLLEMSDGTLTLPEDFSLATTKELLHLLNSNTSFYVTPAKPKKKKKKKKKKKNNTPAE